MTKLENCLILDGDMFQCIKCEIIATHKELKQNSFDTLDRCYCGSICFRSIK